MIDHRSGYTYNLSSCEIKAWKKFRHERDSNRYSALAIWEMITLWVRNIPLEVIFFRL